MSEIERRIRRVAGTAQVLGRAVKESFVQRSADTGGAGAPDVPAPGGLDQYARHVHASRLLAVPASSVGEVLGDLTALGDWATLHQSWRSGPTVDTVPGDELVQIIRLMDIPAQVRWIVMRLDESGFALRGTGPMGITLGLWGTVVAAGDDSAVRLDAGLDGSPLRGPIGSTAVRSVEVALHDSLVELERLAGGARGLRASADPVQHEASGQALDPRTPVIVGVGQVTHRSEGAVEDREPARLCAEALRSASVDSGARLDLLAAADHVHAVPSASWTYGDQAGVVAELVGAGGARTSQSSVYGGDGPQLVLNDAAELLATGEARIVLVTGAESGATMSRVQARGQQPPWPRNDEGEPDRRLGVDRSPNNEVETSVGLGAPIFVYALLESALRGAEGRSDGEQRAHVGELWSGFSAVAARNPHAWDRTARSAEEITTATPDNRRVTSEYTKLMCANMQVDQATGIILTTVGVATAAGVPQDRWVFPHGGASATDEWFVSERADLTRSPAIAAAGAAALADAGITADDLGPVDLYACFPSAVQIAARSLGLPLDDPARPLTLTGGLTFAGGPGNNYGAHAVATLVERLREDSEAYGLSTSLGWYATKHAVGVYSARPPARLFEHQRPLVDRPAPRPAVLGLRGEGVVEAATAIHDRDGGIEALVVSAVRPDGTRALARIEDPAAVETLTAVDLLGRAVVGDGDALTLTDDTDQHPLPAPPPAPVTSEHTDGIAVVTLDRPEVRNAIDLRTAVALERAIDDAEADPTVRVIVLTGNGPTFCAGMDLAAAASGSVPVTEHRGPLGITRQPPEKPLVVAVEGDALAGGMELVLLADIVVAAAGAHMGLPEARRGLVAAAGGLWRSAVTLPRNVALELGLTGRPLPVERLAELGLVNRVVEPGTTLAAALELAGQIAANAPLSVAATRRIVHEAAEWSADEGFDRQTELATPVIMSDDAREGVAAFAERREPRWTGR